MNVQTTRFGEIDIREEDTIAFPRGLIGFPDLRRFVLIDHPGGGPFRWLQSVDSPSVAFAVADPLLFFPDYRVPITADELAEIKIAADADGVVVVILVVPRDPRRITANLQGPVVMNPRERLGMQIVLAVPEYTTKHRIFAREHEAEEAPQRG